MDGYLHHWNPMIMRRRSVSQYTACLAVTLIAGSNGADAQSWFPDEAVWHYNYASGFGAVGHVRLSVEGDTVVAGTTLRKLHPVQEVYDHIGGQYHSFPLPAIPVMESEGLVLAWSHAENTLDTLCDMNAMPGDSWRLPRLPDWRLCADSSYVQVLDTGTLVLGGVALRWLAVETHFLIADMPGWPPPLPDTLIERIGSTTLYFLAHDICNGSVDGHSAGPFRCYADDEVLLNLDPDIPCDFIVGVNELTAPGVQALLHIHPNPASAWVAIDYDLLVEPSHAAIVIRDIAGREVKRIMLREQQQQVVWDTRQAPPGSYTATLLNKGRQLRTEKFIISP